MSDLLCIPSMELVSDFKTDINHIGLNNINIDNIIRTYCGFLCDYGSLSDHDSRDVLRAILSCTDILIDYDLKIFDDYSRKLFRYSSYKFIIGLNSLYRSYKLFTPKSFIDKEGTIYYSTYSFRELRNNEIILEDFVKDYKNFYIFN